jgi:hypothetical protein
MKHQVTLGQRAMRLALCATVVSAALATHSAHAAIVVVDFTGNPFSTVPYNIDGFYLNVVTGATATSSFAGYDINPYFSGSGTASALFRFLTPTTTGGVISVGGIATSLAPGSVIGPAATFASGVVNANAATPGTNTFGFKFSNDATPAVTYYGYIVVQQLANPPVAGSVKILSYAYENTGLSISTPVPEPTTAWLALVGAMGVGALRLRQAARDRDAA